MFFTCLPHTYIPTHTHAHTYPHTHSHTYPHTHSHTYQHTHVHIYPHTRINTGQQSLRLTLIVSRQISGVYRCVAVNPLSGYLVYSGTAAVSIIGLYTQVYNNNNNNIYQKNFNNNFVVLLIIIIFISFLLKGLKII